MKYNHKYNDILIKDNFAILICKSKTFGTFESFIDIEDIPKIEDYYWHIRFDKRHPKHYVESMTSGKRIHLHRFLLGLNGKFNRDKTVDHINGNSLDNRKTNLRICTHKENMQNVSLSMRNKAGIKFITWCSSHKRWRVVYKTKYYGQFKELEDAIKKLKEITNVKIA